ncbi:probable G-protein coupled receptor Mth-like 12 isoform X1 [Drosophila teissieri]|uniref:probable G-protein coupled receptor Mth-like 12 isoform X1 n=1 Tax=Drosophila teissieri TaxID=7243 RepID=UPI001CB9FC8E|nr:probable G-protein coupled receptor Mth-like 12 isoform X1 [Drosophila teissieri]
MKLKLFGTFLVLSLAKFGAVHTDSNDTEAKSCVKCDNNCNDDNDLWHCIRICCPRKNMMANGGCSFEEQLFRTKLCLNIKLDDNSTETLYFNNQTLHTTPFWDIDEMIGLTRDDYTLYKNGTIYIHSEKRLRNKTEYCFYPHQIYSDFPQTIWIVLHEWSSIEIPGTYELTPVSLICYIFIIGIYLFVKELRNVFGMCLVSCIFCIFLTYLIWLIDELRWIDDFCSLAGYISYFFDFATYLWLSITSFCLWKKVTAIDREEHRHQFMFYSIFVWGISAIPLGIILLMNHLWEDDLQKWNWLPLVGFSRCSVEVYRWSSWAYYRGPFMILSAINIIMFILTINHIKKTKREINKLTKRADGTKTCLTVDFQKILSYLRIFAIMGGSWILFLISLVKLNTNFWNIYVILIRVLHRGLGILICVLLIFKRSTYRLLINK